MYVDTPHTMHRTRRHDRRGRVMDAGTYSWATTTCASAATEGTHASIAPKSAVAGTFASAIAKALNARPPRRGVQPH